MVRCPLTANLGAVLDAIRAIRPGSVLPGGTNLGAALATAADCFDDREPAAGHAVVLISDGEDHAESWPDAVDRLRASGIAGHAIAIGDDSRGHEIPAGAAAGSDRPASLQHDGSPVLSRRVDSAFDAMAEATGGVVIRLGLSAPDEGLGRLYRDRIAPAATRAVARLRPSDRADRSGPFVAAAFGLAVAASRAGRRRPVARRRLAASFGLLALAAGAGPGPSPSAAVAAGRSAYDAGRFEAALASFGEAIRLAPTRAVPRYDAASALYRLGRFPEATARYAEARDRADSRLWVKIDYALGNARLIAGDPAGAIRHYDDCLKSPARGPGLDAVRRDAAVNRRFAEEHLGRRPSTAGDVPPDSPSARDRDPAADPKAGDDPDTPGGPGSSKPGPAPDGRRPPAGGRDPSRRGVTVPDADGPDETSPADRLAEAMGRAVEARKSRLPEDPSPPSAGGLKDW